MNLLGPFSLYGLKFFTTNQVAKFFFLTDDYLDKLHLLQSIQAMELLEAIWSCKLLELVKWFWLFQKLLSSCLIDSLFLGFSFIISDIAKRCSVINLQQILAVRVKEKRLPLGSEERQDWKLLPLGSAERQNWRRFDC